MWRGSPEGAMFRWPWKRKGRTSPEPNSTAASPQNIEPPAQLPLPLPTISLPEESSTDGESVDPQKVVAQSQGRPRMRFNVPKHKNLHHQASSTSDYGSITSHHDASSAVSESSSHRLRANSNVSSSSLHSDISSTSTYYSAQGHSPTDGKRLPMKGSATSPVFTSKERERLEQLEKKCQKYEEKLQEHAELKKRVCDLESKLSQMQERERHAESSVARAGGGEGEGDAEESPCAITTHLAEGIGIHSTVKRSNVFPMKQNQSTVIQRCKTDTQLMKLEQHDQLRRKRERMQYIKKFTSCPEPSQLPNRACKREVILWLANKVSSWKFLGRWLGLEETDIRRIVAENSESVREQCYQMFVQWENLHPEMYSYCVLGEALANDEENRSLYSWFVEEVEHQEATFSL